MIGFIMRLLGLVSLSAAFVTLVIDGTRSIANSYVNLTTLKQVIETTCATCLLSWERSLAQTKIEFIWANVVVHMLTLPLFGYCAVFGIIFLVLGRKPHDEIGFDTRQ